MMEGGYDKKDDSFTRRGFNKTITEVFDGFKLSTKLNTFRVRVAKSGLNYFFPC